MDHNTAIKSPKVPYAKYGTAEVTTMDRHTDRAPSPSANRRIPSMSRALASNTHAIETNTGMRRSGVRPSSPHDVAVLTAENLIHEATGSRGDRPHRCVEDLLGESFTADPDRAGRRDQDGHLPATNQIGGDQYRHVCCQHDAGGQPGRQVRPRR